MSLAPLQLLSVSLADRNQLPTCSAIYCAIDASDRILYVGKAQNLAARWKSHHRLYKLEEIDKKSPVRIAWKAWNKEDLTEAEKRLIRNFQPLLNNTKVETPTVIPSEDVLRDFLKTFSRRLIIFGTELKSSDQLLQVHLKYDCTNCSPKGTATKIKEYIKTNKDRNTSLKFKWHSYSKFDDFAGEVFRPGSRAHKKRAREHRSYNNHWELGCNGVVIHITPVYWYSEYKKKTQKLKLAAVNLPAITPEAFSEAQKSNDYEFYRLSCYVSDPVPLLWSK
ncbi:MAG: GIY-YIG nuclease family protein [Okeania sp. SIO2D1]|nr:GIY-YIG nuclease family protein [Okeania sp. SIO2D1]